jgi:hypothetical protein
MKTTGSTGKWIFLIGFWGAVFSSMLGVWSGIPYIFHEFVTTVKNKDDKDADTFITKSKLYRGFLLFLTLPPISLLFLNKPVWVIITYSVAGAFFMPFMAGTLLYLNNKKKWISSSGNGIPTNVILISSFLLFLLLFWHTIQ